MGGFPFSPRRLYLTTGLREYGQWGAFLISPNVRTFFFQIIIFVALTLGLYPLKNIMHKEIINRVINKAKKSICQYKIAAIGISDDGRVLGCYTNIPRFARRGGGIHAEMQVMKNFKGNLKTILITRIGGSGILPIHPCPVCKEKANELNVKIISLHELFQNKS